MPGSDNQRPTLKTIAEITGLSQSTVSLSLRDGSNLKKSTRDKVARAAAQIGYVPNRAGVRLRTGRTHVLSLVLAGDENSLDFTRKLIQGIGARLRDTRFHLNVVPEFDPQDPVASVRYIMENRAADGMILTHTSARDPRVQLLMDADFPFVSHGRTEFYSPHAYHDFNAEKYIDMAVNRLVEKGRRHMLLAAVDDATTYYAIVVNSFNRAIARASVSGRIIDQENVFTSTESAREFAQALALQDEPFDGIICNNELTALALIGGLQDAGTRLGKDYDLVCRQTAEILPTLYPQLDTVSEDLFATGEELARLLLSRIDGDPVETLQTLHEPRAHWRSAHRSASPS